MANNRKFQRPKFKLHSLKASLTDVTETARRWNATFAMCVHSELLGKYTIPDIAADDEGYYLVGAMVQEIDAVIEGRLSSRLVSYGNFLGMEFAFRAQRRRTLAEEVLQLRVFLGPCDGNQLVACVVRSDAAS